MLPCAVQAIVDSLARDLGRPVPPDARDRLVAFAELVRTWNARMNLTAARTPEALGEVLFADALVLADRSLVPDGARFVDVGTGAGAPAVPLLLLRPDLTGVLVEPLRKRVAFLRTAVGGLDLAARARVAEAKVDPARPTVPGGPFDVALSRATLAPDEWLRVGLALAPRVLVLTAQDPPSAPPGAAREPSIEYRLPSSGAPRRITGFSRQHR